MPDKKGNEVEDFFDTLKREDEKVKPDIFEKPEKDVVKEEVKKDEVVPEKEESTEPVKNRRHRRLEQQLQDAREEIIRIQARNEGRSEVEKFQESTGEVPEKWLRIYGDTPESRTAWKLQEELFMEQGQRFKEQTIKEIREEQESSEKEQRKYENFIDSELEAIEDEYDIDLTSDSPSGRKMRNDFLELIEKISPKDENGDITDYADFQSTWELFQSRQEVPDNSRQRQVASRSMQKSGATVKSTAVDDATEKYLKDQGIIN